MRYDPPSPATTAGTASIETTTTHYPPPPLTATIYQRSVPPVSITGDGGDGFNSDDNHSLPAAATHCPLSPVSTTGDVTTMMMVSTGRNLLFG